MSLINQMLQDLETRRNSQAESVQKRPVYEDLKPISAVSRSRAPSRRVIGLASLIVVLGAGAYAWMQWGDDDMSLVFSDKVAVKPEPVARKAAPKPAPIVSVAAPSVAVAPVIPVNTPPLPATANSVTPQATPMPAAAETAIPSESPSSEALPVQATRNARSRADSVPVTKKDHWVVSRGETLYGISVKTGVSLLDLSKWNGLNRDYAIQPGQRLRLTSPGGGDTARSAARQTAKVNKPKSSVKAREEKTTLVAATASVWGKEGGNALMDRKLKPLSPDEKAETEYRRAVELLEKGRAGDAERHLKAALGASETHVKARELYAGLLLQQGHWRETQQLLEKGIDKVPDYHPFAQLLARVYVEHGADQKALAVMERSRRAAADSPDYVAFLAILYQRAGRHAEAVKAYNEALALLPQEGRWWLGAGISLEAVQDWSAAGAAYQRAVDSGALDENLLTYARQRLAVVKNK